MSDDNKEGAGVPVAEIVTFGGLDGQKEVSWRKGKMPPVGTKLYTTPPAVMPAAPSEIELQHREALDCLDSVMRAASHVLVGLAPSEKEAKLRSVLSKAHDWCMAERAALSQTMQPQAAQPAGQEPSIVEQALREIATLTNRTATPEQFARHLQRIASKALNGGYDE